LPATAAESRHDGARRNAESPGKFSAIVSPARIGFIGLGRMGHPMARNLARAGYAIVAHDVDGDALKRACEATGAEAATSLKPRPSVATR